MLQLLSKFTGSLIGSAIGDSLGARVEGSTGFQEVTDIAPRYTDDTAMTIGTVESLIECKGFDHWAMADRLIRIYEREPWRRYGSGPSQIFRKMQSGKRGFGQLDRDIYPGGSLGNGGAMRISPIGLLYHDDPKTIRELSYHAAGITHSHELALEGAAVQACAVALAVLAEPPSLKRKEFLGALRMFTLSSSPYQEQLKVIERLWDSVPDRKEVVEVLGNGLDALHSVPTAVFCFLTKHDFESAVTYAVSLGGDADTIGSMTGAIAGAFYGIEGIPRRWREKVENREYIEELALRLSQLQGDLPRHGRTPNAPPK